MIDTVKSIEDLQSIMSEIFTLDSSGNILSQNISQNYALSSLPPLSIGKIFRGDGAYATGFAVGENSNGPIILTCKHVAINLFIREQMPCCICFEPDQSQYSLDNFINKHKCGVAYSLRLLDIASASDDPQNSEVDAITGVEYAVPFDAALFQVENKCICGAPVSCPRLQYLQLTDQRPPRHISIHGFMGDLTPNSVPLIDISSVELQTLQLSIRKGVLTVSEGELLDFGSLAAVTCPTTAGFSGSPLVADYSAQGLKVWGIFISGPALYEHEFFVTLANTYSLDKTKAKEMLENITPLSHPYASSISPWLLFAYQAYDRRDFLAEVCKAYASVIFEYRKKGYRYVTDLNHNLCLPLYRIAGFLRKHGILLN